MVHAWRIPVYVFMCTPSCVRLHVYTFLCTPSCVRLHVVITSNTLVCMYIRTYLVNHRRSPHTCTAHTSHCRRQHVNVFCKPLYWHICVMYNYCMHIQFYVLGNCLLVMANLPATPLPCYTQQIVMRILWRSGTKTHWSH